MKGLLRSSLMIEAVYEYSSGGMFPAWAGAWEGGISGLSWNTGKQNTQQFIEFVCLSGIEEIYQREENSPFIRRVDVAVCHLFSDQCEAKGHSDSRSSDSGSQMCVCVRKCAHVCVRMIILAHDSKPVLDIPIKDNSVTLFVPAG